MEEPPYDLETPLEDIIIEREEILVSLTGGRPVSRKAIFIKPSRTSVPAKHPFEEASSLPPIFEPKNWKLKVDYQSWRFPTEKWKSWVKKMAALHAPTWRKAGIYEPIMSSTYKIIRNPSLILGVAEKWCPETNSFIFPWGEATITLEDLVVLQGFSVLGSSVSSPLENSEMEEINEKLQKEKSKLQKTPGGKAIPSLWMNTFMDSGKDIEHEAFLAMWLSRCVLVSNYTLITSFCFPIAVRLARGIRVSLAPAVLAAIYRDLSLLKKKIVALTDLKMDDEFPLKLNLWSLIHLVQIWVWERFVDLKPNPNLIQYSEPRLARWNNLSRTVENTRLVLDLAKDTFDWRPYGKNLTRNWIFPKLYGVREMWLTAQDSSDDEFVAYARIIRVSELVGINCVEQYLPNRVALQFGMDQDLPGFVPRVNGTPEMAWNFYTRRVSDAKLYVPARLFEGDVTTGYIEWWNKPVSGIKVSQRFHECVVTSKRKPKNSRKKKCKVAALAVKKAKQCVRKSSTKSAECSKVKLEIEEDVDSDYVGRVRKTLPLSFVTHKDILTSPYPPGFPPKSSAAEVEHQVEVEVEVEDQLTVAEFCKSRKRRRSLRKRKNNDRNKNFTAAEVLKLRMEKETVKPGGFEDHSSQMAKSENVKVTETSSRLDSEVAVGEAEYDNEGGEEAVEGGEAAVGEADNDNGGGEEAVGEAAENIKEGGEEAVGEAAENDKEETDAVGEAKAENDDDEGDDCADVAALDTRITMLERLVTDLRALAAYHNIVIGKN